MTIAKLTPDLLARVSLTPTVIAAFCDRWHVIELAFFGSVLRDDFTPQSDLDCLVTFAPDQRIGLFRLVEMSHELSDLVDRPVDLVLKSVVETSHNWIRRNEILSTFRVVYAAQ